MTETSVLIGIGFIALCGYAVVLVKRIWRSVRGLFTQVRATGSVISSMWVVTEGRVRTPISATMGNPESLAKARELRQEIRAERSEARERRLESALERWPAASETFAARPVTRKS